MLLTIFWLLSLKFLYITVFISILCLSLLVFFFQAEDGIRDIGVTGVQTCALPISEDVRNAHSLELETLGELGIVGLLLLLVLLGSVVAATVRSRRRPGGLARSQVADRKSVV